MATAEAVAARVEVVRAEVDESCGVHVSAGGKGRLYGSGDAQNINFN